MHYGNNMTTVGLTGGIGSGKSLIAGIFESMGIPCYNSDLRARSLMHTSDVVRLELIELFGPDIYVDAKLNRQAIAAAVFSDSDLLARLNAIVHPAVAQDFETWIEELPGISPYAIKESALIFEAGIDAALDKTILVTAPVAVRIERVVARDNVTAEAVKARMEKQWTDTRKIPLADYVINNDGQTPLIRQVLEIHRDLTNQV